MNLDFGVQLSQEEEKNQSSLSAKQLDPPVNEQKNFGMCGFFSVGYYQPYFNVTQKDVSARLLAAMVPVKHDFFHIIQNNPDLWGPVWICATLVLLIAAAGNFTKYLQSSKNENVIQLYDYEYIPFSAGLLYAIVFGTPVVISGLMKYFGIAFMFFQTLCLYGYSMAILVPITILCSIPQSWIQWPLVLYGFISSSYFIILNLEELIRSLDRNQKIVINGFIGFIQFSLYLVFKLIFFKIITQKQL